jgi:xanthosine utilization system XapX-like protein
MLESVVSAFARFRLRRPAVLILVALLCTLLGAQVLETTMFLPDSLVGTTQPQCLAWDSTDNVVYVGGNDGARVIAFDAATGAKLAAIPAGAGTASTTASTPRTPMTAR